MGVSRCTGATATRCWEGAKTGEKDRGVLGGVAGIGQCREAHWLGEIKKR
jgi:hypothetical protein